MKLHQNARFKKPAEYPNRFPVPDEKVRWNTPFPEYQPPYYVSPNVLGEKLAAPEEITKISGPFKSFESNITCDELGRPRNPYGRTGLKGRGLLWNWGANFAADALLTRINPETNLLEALLIQRKDNLRWAIPGGMIDGQESLNVTATRELAEETGLKINMADAEIVYQGYIDDPRNTDHAWLESMVFYIHIDYDPLRHGKMEAGDDAQDVQWVVITRKLIENIYASHGESLRRALFLISYFLRIETLYGRCKKAQRQVEEILETY